MIWLPKHWFENRFRLLYDFHDVAMITTVSYGYRNVGLCSDLMFCMISRCWYNYRVLRYRYNKIGLNTDLYSYMDT